jgi:protein TonB
MGHPEQFEYEEKRTFMGRYGFAIGGCVVAVIVVVMLSQMFSGHSNAPPARKQDMVMIKALPPTPPPPAPPTPPPQVEPKQQMIEQAQDTDPVKPVEQPVDQTPALGSNIQGNGPPDGFGLSGHGNGFLNGSGSGSRGGGSRFGWYASEVVSSVGDALRQNSHTRNASFNIKVRIWSDLTGRITRSKLAGSTGDLTVDNAIQNEVLNGLQLKEPPPDGMPMPIVMRLAGRRPD